MGIMPDLSDQLVEETVGLSQAERQAREYFEGSHTASGIVIPSTSVLESELEELKPNTYTKADARRWAAALNVVESVVIVSEEKASRDTIDLLSSLFYTPRL